MTQDTPNDPDATVATPQADPPASEDRPGVVPLALRGVRREFEGVVAVEDVRLTVPAGTCTVLAGRNGSGKTTTLQLAAGRLAPTAGSVEIDGRDVSTVAGGRHGRHAVTFAFDTPVFYPDLTFAAQPWGPSPEVCLCTAASKLLDAAGVAVSLDTSGELGSSALHTVCATDGARPGETLQFDLGEGPSYTAHRTGRPVQVADLEGDDTWPVFTAAATALGYRAVFAFPLRSGSDSLGALTLYQHVAGGLTSEQYADALAVAAFALTPVGHAPGGAPTR